MRIVVVDSDKTFTASFSQRCQKASVFCQIIPASASAFAEIKKSPDNVDIVLISRELAAGQDGLLVAQMIRKDPKTVDIPYIIMSTTWGKTEFAKHQKTEFGAMAYYNKKTSLTELDAAIEAVTGFKFGSVAPAPAGGANAPTGKTGNTGLLNIKLQAASDVVNISEEMASDISMSEPISLFDAEEASAPAPAAPAAPAAPSLTSGTGIKLSAGTGTNIPKPEAQKPAPAAAAPPPPSEGGIDINFGGGNYEVETAKGRADVNNEISVPPVAPPSTGANMQINVPPSDGAEAKAPQVEGSLFAVDLSAVEENPQDAQSPAAAAPAPTAAPTPAPPQAAGPGTVSGIELSMAAVPSEPVAAAPPGPPASKDASTIDIGSGVSLAAAVPAVAEAPIPPPPIDTGAASMPAPDIAISAQEAAPPAPPVESAAPSSVSEEEAAKDLPYLFAGGASSIAPGSTTFTRSTMQMPQMAPARPMGEMGGGGGGNNEDVETLKKYLTMREQDVSVLTAQLSYAKEELGKSEDTIKRLTLQNEDLYHQINDLKAKNGTLEQELQHASKNREGEVDQLRFEVKAKIDRIKFLEDRLNDSAQQYEKLKERVRLDIRKIRIREKELESKLEILKKDSETLIAARENKILELKRKIDLLEFNYDTLQDKNDMEKQNVVKAHEKIDRVLKVIKLAVGVIEAEGEHGATSAQGEKSSEAAGGARSGEKVA